MRHAQIKIYMLENTKQMFFPLAGRIHIFIWCIIHFPTHTWHHEKPMTVQNVLSLFHCDRGDEQDADLLQGGNRRLFLVFQGHWVMWSSCLRAYVKTVFMRVYIGGKGKKYTAIHVSNQPYFIRKRSFPLKGPTNSNSLYFQGMLISRPY